MAVIAFQPNETALQELENARDQLTYQILQIRRQEVNRLLVQARRKNQYTLLIHELEKNLIIAFSQGRLDLMEQHLDEIELLLNVVP